MSIMIQNKNSRHRGFTIVELLIVIVVIGILAAIVIVAYQGIQQRAFNTATVNSVQQTIKLMKAYKTANSEAYPVTGSRCLTIDNQCTAYNDSVVTADNSALITELRKIGQPPNSVSKASSTMYGIYMDYYAPRTYNHNYIPGLIMYTLRGTSQNCGVQDVVAADSSPLPSETNAFISSSTGYTANANGNTRCWVSI